MVERLFNPADDDWIIMVGRYMLNMGVVEFATRVIINIIEGTDSAPKFSADLATRIGFIRKKFPHKDCARHQWAMNALDVAARHARFRNSVAHSPLVLVRLSDGTHQIGGILNVTPKSTQTMGQIISLEELTGRVNESAIVARSLLDMQEDFRST